MRSETERFAKLAFIFFGLLFLVGVWLGRRQAQPTPSPEGEKITVEDVEILLDALGTSVTFPETTVSKDGTDENGEQIVEDAGASYLTYGQYLALCGQLEGEDWKLPHYEKQYETEHGFLKKDWYEAFRILLAHLDTENAIWETTVFLLKVDREAREVYTENGALQGGSPYLSPAFAENVFQEMRVYVKGDTLLTIVEVLPEEHELGSVWVMESTDGVLDCFYRQTAFRAETSEEVSQIPERERIADLTFREGKVVAAKERNDKVHGKLLRMSGDELEIEGCGIYQIHEKAEVYKLYGSLKTLELADLRVGCADTDFVVYKQKVYACLVSEAQDADQIRVLLKNNGTGSNYHEAVELTVDGEHTKLRAEQMTIGERRTYRSENLTDKVLIEMEGSSREDHAYRGAIECLRMEEGIVVVNELPLEEYLYAVVPSEMPASYPMEALKAQAVCARTYAYRYILRAGLPALGAHVDDTTAYQVYHNIGEHAATTTAVKETDGVLLTYQGEAAGNYYYSTSCGAGTDMAGWRGGAAEDIAYLQAERLCSIEAFSEEGTEIEAEQDAQKKYDGEALQEEDVFRQFITTVHETDLEKDEPWYRWTYQVKELDEKRILSRLQERYQAAPAFVLTKTQGEYYVAEPIGKLGKIRALTISKRGAGGIAQELLVEGEEATVKVVSEYHIRCVLCDGESPAVRQDGSETVPKTLLPSGFFVLDPVFSSGKGGEYVVGYTLSGGGYGHGVGMSQNGAKALATEDVLYEQILETFYPGCELMSSEKLKEL